MWGLLPTTKQCMLDFSISHHRPFDKALWDQEAELAPHPLHIRSLSDKDQRNFNTYLPPCIDVSLQHFCLMYVYKFKYSWLNGGLRIWHSLSIISCMVILGVGFTGVLKLNNLIITYCYFALHQIVDLSTVQLLQYIIDDM